MFPSDNGDMSVDAWFPVDRQEGRTKEPVALLRTRLTGSF
jgi:hypothetical protein